jgi:plasmid rolling circle replication initiator protein Rep
VSKLRHKIPKKNKVIFMNNHNTKTTQSQEEKFNDKKRKNKKLLPYISKHVTTSGSERIEYCCQWMKLISDRELSKRRMIEGNTCKNRFCPMCAWRKAKKDVMIIAVMILWLRSVHKKEFIVLTLTVPNVTGDELDGKIKQMNVAFSKLFKRQNVLVINKGYIRKLEVTCNNKPVITKEMWFGNKKKKIKPLAGYFMSLGLKVGDANPNYNTYHPHFHIVIAVNKRYFKSSDYIKQSDWLQMWRNVMKDQSITQVDVRKMKHSSDGLDKGVNEIAKYAAKDGDYLHSQDVFDVFYTTLKGKQLITFNGLFKEAKQLYISGELDSFKTPDPTFYELMLLSSWRSSPFVDSEGVAHDGNQYQTESREMTDEELIEYNGNLVSEMEVERDD